MSAIPIQFKQRNVLKIFVFVLIGFILLVIGLIGYFTSENFMYFYLVVAANLIIAYIFFISRVKKNQVVYDPAFVKYKLNAESNKIKNTLLIKALLVEQVLEIQLKEDENLSIDLEDYHKDDQIYFEKLLNALAPPS
ncbi:hypothetical protein RBU60_03730 [Mesonia sp. MT50]|uniref:Uncharacterized protein n=1 Tax=Mesonia profundi TaxID=3070998 RepID=A0ABU1A1C0_9FLAO|nr:hypothetical protein [Mesonia profundi]MDQ7916674.1 hypothetical protein [Mesonia profundi]